MRGKGTKTKGMTASIVEYSRSARAKCRICGAKIAKDALRIGTEVFEFGFMTTRWNHLHCFDFSNVTNPTDIQSGFGMLKAADQVLVSSYFGKKGTAVPRVGIKRKACDETLASSLSTSSSSSSSSSSLSLPSTQNKAKTKKRGRTNSGAPQSVQDFDALEQFHLGVSKIEYAKAKKPSPCMHCYGKIANGEPRVGNREQAWQFEGIMSKSIFPSCLALIHCSRLTLALAPLLKQLGGCTLAARFKARMEASRGCHSSKVGTEWATTAA